jgi:3',5'-cyclic AMP phosphodiesterase CpdA
MLIAQISDLHIGFDGPSRDDANLRRLDRALAELEAMPGRPDLLLATGDLVEHGDEASYRLLHERLAACPIPSHPMLGNHDRRAGFRAAFPGAPDVSGYLQYVIETPGLRIVMLDTLEEGRHGGAFCEIRAAWLTEKLAEAPDTPTLVVLHHPPIDTGIEWMMTDPAEPWVARLRAALAGHGQIVALISGHIHRPVLGMFEGLPTAVAPATAYPLALTLEPMDIDHPDNRPLVTDGPPAYALHRWQDGRFITHFGFADDPVTIVAYGERMQPLVRRLAAERPGKSKPTAKPQ